MFVDRRSKSNLIPHGVEKKKGVIDIREVSVDVRASSLFL